MPEDSVTVMLLPEDDTETILEKVRQTGAKKVSLIVPPGTRSLQTLGGFTMLRKACDITGIDVTVYSEDEKTRDMATVCRFEVVSLDQGVRPRPAPPPEEEPPIVVSTRPPEPAGLGAQVPAEAVPAGMSAATRERAAGELSADDLALFDALESMSLEEDIELGPGTFGRGATGAAVQAATERPVPPPRVERPPKAKKPKAPSPFRTLLDPVANAVSNIYIAVVGLFLRVAQRSLQRGEKAAVLAAEGPAPVIAPQTRTEEEVRLLRRQKMRYSLWALVAVIGFTIVVVGLYALFQPEVTVSLTPHEAEMREMDVSLNVVLTNTVDPKSSVNTAGGTAAIVAEPVQVELEGSASTPATGATTIPEGTATGAVVFVNVSGYAVDVPAGTTVAVPGGGVTFHTTQDVWLPGSDFRGPDAYLGKAQVNVVADTPGSAGNVAAAAISEIQGDLNGVLTVENSEPTSGGSERQATIVTSEDRDLLRQQLVEGLRAQAYSQLQAQLGDLQVLSGTLQIETVEESFSHGVGSEAVTLTLSAKVRASALASAPGALDKAVMKAVEQEVQPKSGQALGEFKPGAIEAVSPGAGVNTWTYRTHVRVPILNTIDDRLRSEILSRLRGKTYQQAEQLLQTYKQISGFAISPVVNRLPSWGRIVVQDVTQVKAK